MDATSDELTAPLGVDRDTRSRPVGAGLRTIVAVAGYGGLVLLAGAAGYALLLGDPLGGLPRARVDIVARPASAPAESAAAEAPVAAASPSGRRTASEVESQSGVSVLRPPGTSAPEAVIVRVPDDMAVALNPVPDPRLADRTRHGTLPRIGADGARPLDVYARPPAGLPGGQRPLGRVAIVLGGLGIGQAVTRDAIARMPPAVTLAVAPYGSDLESVAAQARAAGHELLLQVPMEPFDYPDSDPGPHTLRAAAGPADNRDHLHWAMGRFAGYVGIVNYMGGKLTADEKALVPILREIGARGLGFLDDGSSSRSVALAVRGSTRAVRAEAVIDAVNRPDAIDKALEKLEAGARVGGGIVVGTATALPLSLDRIERWAKGLESRGVLLVPVSAAFRDEPRENAAR